MGHELERRSLGRPSSGVGLSRRDRACLAWFTYPVIGACSAPRPGNITQYYLRSAQMIPVIQTRSLRAFREIEPGFHPAAYR